MRSPEEEREAGMDNAAIDRVIDEHGGEASPLIARVDQIIDKHGGEASALIQVLLEIQS